MYSNQKHNIRGNTNNRGKLMCSEKLVATQMLQPPQWGDYRIVIVYQVMESIKQPSK
jgi:hypothetical protein